MGSVFFFQWEIDFIVWIQIVASDFTILLARFFTFCGEEYFLIFILGLIYWSINKDLGRKVAIAMSSSLLLGTLIKGIVLRRRPYMDNESVKCLRAPHAEGDLYSPKDQGFSMPSLHSAMSVATYGSIAYNLKKKFSIIIAIVVPFLIGLSRPFMGAHYPTDVLIGWIVGLICVFLFGAIEKKFGYKVPLIILLIIGIAGFFYCRDAEFYSGYGVTLGILIGFTFEEKLVKFEHCKKWWTYIVRPIVGVLIFILVSTLLKLPVKNLTLADDNAFMLAYRTFRYAFSTFVIIGIYPFLFKLCKNKI